MGLRVSLPLCLALACTTPQRPPKPPPATTLLGQRAIHGAHHRFDPGATLRVHVAEAGRWRLEIDGQPIGSRREERAGAVVLSAPAQGGRLTLRGPDGEVAGWQVRVAPAPDSFHPAAVAARKAGRLDEALASLRLEGVGGEARLWGEVEVGRVHHRKGDLDEAIVAWKRAAETADALGVASEAASRWRAIAFILFWRGDLDEMVPYLDRAAARSRALSDVVGTLRVNYLRGVHAWKLGALRQARLTLTDAMKTAESYGLADEARVPGVVLTSVLGTVGRHAEARRLVEGPLARYLPEGDSRRAIWLTAHAWVLLVEAARRDGGDLGHCGRVATRRAARAPTSLGRSACRSVLGRAERMLESAYRTYIAQGDQPRADNVAVNRAWAALLRGDPSAAAARAAEASDQRGLARLLRLLIKAELAAADHREAEAKARYTTLLEAALAEDAREYIWRALLGRARSQPDSAAAIADYLAGLDAVERAARSLGVRADAAPFFADRRALVDEAVAMLIERRLTSRAFEVAERGRARVLNSLERRLAVERLSDAQRVTWRRHVATFTRARVALEALEDDDAMTWRSEDRARLGRDRERLQAARARSFDAAYAWLAEQVPRPPRATSGAVMSALGERDLLLAATPAGIFAVRSTGITWHTHPPPLRPPGSPPLGLLYLVGFDGDWSDKQTTLFDYQTNSGDAAALGEARHLPDASFLLRDGVPTPGPALVAGDPTRDLPGARAEARRFSGAGDTLLLGDKVTREALLGGLAGARRFHFAGHGALRPGDPWDAHLALAGGERLTLEDVLLARPRVGLVVLSGCRTGAATDLGGERVGLPEAFLAAGARAVLATRRDIGEAEARRFIDRFYASANIEEDPGAAFTAAVRASIRAGDDVWRAFRLWGRG